MNMFATLTTRGLSLSGETSGNVLYNAYLDHPPPARIS